MIADLHRGNCTEWKCRFHPLDGSHLLGLEESFSSFFFIVFDFFVDLACLAEDVKLSANGRQPTLFLSFSFTNTSPVDFHDAYTARVVLYFSRQAFFC
jgi:hypothetical protein